MRNFLIIRVVEFAENKDEGSNKDSGLLIAIMQKKMWLKIKNNVL